MPASSKLVSLALIVSACAAPTGQTTTTSVTQTRPPPAPTTTQPLVEGCEAGGQFVEGGVIDEFGNTGSDSTTIGPIRWQAEESCETFEIGFQTAEGAPATTPPSVTAEFVADIGVLRLSTSATGTVVTDQLVETRLVDRLYVVRSLEGGMFVDLHLRGPAQARLELESSPARLVLRLQPGIVGHAAMPTRSDRVVLISPTEGAEVPTMVQIAGYGRTFESNVLLIATQGDAVVDQESITASDSVETWGEFSGELSVVPGAIELFVGEQSADSGRFEGVTIDLSAR